MFFLKDAQKKFDLQLETLQQEAQALQRQLTAEQAQVLIKTGLVDQLQEDLAELNATLQAQHAAIRTLQQDGQGELAALSAAKGNLQSQVQELSTRIEGAQQLTAALETEKSALVAEITGLKAQVSTLQSEMESERAQRAQTLEQLNQQRAQFDQTGTQSGSQIKQLQAAQTYLQERLSVTEKDVHKAKAELTKARQEADAALNKARAEAAAASESAAKELVALRKQLQAKGGVGAGLPASPDSQAKHSLQIQAQYEDSLQENELLLLQLMQAQEELVEYYEDKCRFEQLYEAVKARWERLETRLPNYVDYGAIELLSFDSLSETPSVTWRVKDFAQGGEVVPEFVFQTVLQDGQPGIGLFLDTQGEVPEGIALVPKLVASSAPQVEKFVALSSTDFRKVSAAAIILAQQEASQWQGFGFPAQFDPTFWRPSLKLLAAQLQSLPPTLRYDGVKLKRELINPDYEHLWVELQGVVFGARSWKKLEVRLGAAMVQPEGFSQFPKFEIPLIDGKTKPFDSWYAESYDDAGPKLELRFSLEKNVFDSAVLGKLEEADRTLVLRLVYAFPDLLRRLEVQQASIHRPWAAWTDFAKGAVQVIELQRQQLAKARAAKKQEADAKNAAAADPAASQSPSAPNGQEVDALPQSAPRPVAKAGPRVISIGNKPAVRPTAKAAPAPPPVIVPVKAPKLAKVAAVSAPNQADKPSKTPPKTSKADIVNA